MIRTIGRIRRIVSDSAPHFFTCHDTSYIFSRCRRGRGRCGRLFCFPASRVGTFLQPASAPCCMTSGRWRTASNRVTSFGRAASTRKIFWIVSSLIAEISSDEHLVPFLLVLLQGIALTVAPEADAFLQVIHGQEVFFPKGIDGLKVDRPFPGSAWHPRRIPISFRA